MEKSKQPKLILFSQHGMAANNKAMGTLAHSLALPHFHVVAPVLGYVNTLFQIEPLIQAVEQSADQTLNQYSDIPARIIATSLGGVLWVEVLDLLREWQIRGFKLLETRAKNRFTQEVYCLAIQNGGIVFSL